MPGPRDKSTNSTLMAQGTDYTVVTAATVNVLARPGRLVKVVVIAGTGTITIYDNAVGNTTGNILWTKTAVAVGDIYAIDEPAAAGISAVAAAATTINVVWS